MRTLALALLLVSGCSFSPDLSRFEPCGEGGACAEGFQCLAGENRCLPACVGDSCPAEPPDSGTPDAGTPLTLATASLAPAVEDTPYAQPLEAAGGVEPYRFHALGALPAGLSVSDGGVLSGTPAVDAGTYPVVAEVVDGEGTQAQRELLLEVRPLLRLAGPVTLAQAREGQDYAEQLASHGGDGRYHYAPAPGSALPPGLTLADDGAVSGNRSALVAGTYGFSVQVTDEATPAQTATRALALTVAAPVLLGPSLAVTTRSIPQGRVGFAYRYPLHFEGGSSSTRWEFSGGLPAGLAFDLDTGVLSGVPTQAGGPFQFFVKLTDGVSSTEQQAFTLDVR